MSTTAVSTRIDLNLSLRDKFFFIIFKMKKIKADSTTLTNMTAWSLACNTNPCLNNGTCLTNNSTNTYNCTCLEGFYGLRCQYSN